MTEAPSIKEALEPCPFCNTAPAFGRMIEPDQVTIGCNNDGCLVQLCVVSDVESEAVKAWNTRAAFQPDGERREAIARAIWEAQHSRIKDPGPVSASLKWRSRTVPDVFWEGYLLDADAALASGLVQDEAGWRPISTAPRDGTLVDVWSEDYGRLTDARYLLSEYTDGVPWGWSSPWRGRITDATHWKPLPAPPIRSARDGGAS